jgi:hypothetical protein
MNYFDSISIVENLINKQNRKTNTFFGNFTKVKHLIVFQKIFKVFKNMPKVYGFQFRG